MSAPLLTSNGELVLAQASGRVPRDIDARQWQMAGAAFQRWDAQWRMPGTWTPAQLGGAVRRAAELQEQLLAGSIAPGRFTAEMTALVRRVGAEGRAREATGEAAQPDGLAPLQARPMAPPPRSPRPPESGVWQAARREVDGLQAALQAHRAERRPETRTALNDRLAQLTSRHRQQAGSWDAKTSELFVALSRQAREALAQPLPGQRGSEAVQALGRAIRAYGEAPGPETRAQMNHALALARSLQAREGAGWTPATRADFAVYGPQAARALGGGAPATMPREQPPQPPLPGARPALASPGAPPQQASRTDGASLREVNDQSPEAREAREREHWQRAHEQAEAIRQRERDTVKLRAPTDAERADRTAGIADPWVRHLVARGPELRIPDRPGADAGGIRASAQPGASGGSSPPGPEPAGTGSRAEPRFDVMPPARTSDWRLEHLDPKDVLRGMRQFEALPHPVSNPAYPYPADPIFANVFRGLAHLGTDELTHEDLSRLVRWVQTPTMHWGSRVSQPTAWDHKLLERIKPETEFAWHDWHVVTGFRGEPAAARWGSAENPVITVTAGHGGETGLFAWLTENIEFDPLSDRFRFRETSLGVWQRQLEYAATTEPLSFGELLPRLSGDPAEAAPLLRNLFRRGYFADAAHAEILWPLIHRLGSTDFFNLNSPLSREDAARQLLANLDERAESARGGVPSYAAAAELQWLEAFRGFLAETNPGLAVDRGFNFVDFHDYYRDQHDKGLLISPDEVEAWLRSNGFPIDTR